MFPIHYTCTRDEFINGEEDRIEMIKLLLENGADINAPTAVVSGKTFIASIIFSSYYNSAADCFENILALI